MQALERELRADGATETDIHRWREGYRDQIELRKNQTEATTS